MKKINAKDQGFTVGMRLGTELALSHNLLMSGTLRTITLHVLKNLANTEGLERECKAFGINGTLYTNLGGK